LVGEIEEVLGENLHQCLFVHHKPHMLLGREPGPPQWEASVYPLELRYGQSLETYCHTLIINSFAGVIKVPLYLKDYNHLPNFKVHSM
jgi:hypothetical protein